ncbi:MAG: putative TetR transcriptional regulator [Frankiales bacterium]|nr:putative TetR transcriptional regulator [Frankiales bacterium]
MEWDTAPASVRAAVERGLARHQRDALGEVDSILEAALRVAERVAPAAPKVADIVAEAGTSNQTFYRYFGGKDDLLFAVLERGLIRVRSYLEHRMAKAPRPLDQVAAWIDGVLIQVTRPTAARQGAAVIQQVVHTGRMREPEGAALTDRLGELLVAPLGEAGSTTPELDAKAIQDVVMGALQRHVIHRTSPDAAEREHLVDFCLRAVSRLDGVPPDVRPAR